MAIRDGQINSSITQMLGLIVNTIALVRFIYNYPIRSSFAFAGCSHVGVAFFIGLVPAILHTRDTYLE